MLLSEDPKGCSLIYINKKWKGFSREDRANTGTVIKDCLRLSIIWTSSGSNVKDRVPLPKVWNEEF
jgi:hypothetical protein